MNRTPLGVKILLGVVTAVVVAAVGYAFYLTGSPAGQRAQRFDQERIFHLQNIAGAVDQYWQRNGRLPESFADLQGPNYYVQSVDDPETGETYEYRPLSERGYQLCATFSTDGSRGPDTGLTPFSQRIWEHGEGRNCFDLEVEPEESDAPQEGRLPTPPARMP